MNNIDYIAAAYHVFSNTNGDIKNNIRMLKDSIFSSPAKLPVNLVSQAAWEVMKLKRGYCKGLKLPKLAIDHIFSRTNSTEFLLRQMQKSVPLSRAKFAEYFLCFSQIIHLTQEEHNKIPKRHGDWIKEYKNNKIRLLNTDSSFLSATRVQDSCWKYCTVYYIENGKLIRNSEERNKYSYVINHFNENPK